MTKQRVAQFSGPEPDKKGIFGQPGDQLDPVYRDDELLDGEVNIIPLVPAEWTKIFRPVQIDIADTLAEQMFEAAHNPNVGYSQGQSRYSFGDALQLFTSASEIDFPVNGDCSSGISGILRAAGIPVRRAMVTATEERDLLETGQFLLIEDAAYLAEPAHFWRGDVLWRPGHTAVCLDGGPVNGILPMIATGRCFRRIGPGISFRSIAVWPKGAKLIAFSGVCSGKWIITADQSGDTRAFTSLKNLDGTGYGQLKITGLTVWIRTGPGMDYERIKLALRGQVYIWTGAIVTDERGVEWYEVELASGRGWISQKYSEVME